MQALVLDGFYTAAPHPEVRDEMTRQLAARDFAVETAVLRELEIAPCRGCFECWVKTPGVCVIDDHGRDLSRRIVQSDLLVLLTPLVFGCFSAELKKAYDRTIPIISPFFMVINGEMHHQRRYRRYPRLLALGTCARADAEVTEIFTTLIKRNALNFHCPDSAAAVYSSEDGQAPLADLIAGLLEQVRPGGMG